MERKGTRWIIQAIWWKAHTSFLELSMKFFLSNLFWVDRSITCGDKSTKLYVKHWVDSKEVDNCEIFSIVAL